jgi:ribonuclease BN (tRNA processing enzyme)
MTQTQPIEFTIVGPTGAGLYPSTSRFVDLLFGEGGAWAYENSFGAPQKIFSSNLPIDPAAAPAVILQTWDGIRVLSVCTHHGDAPADAYRVEYGAHSVTFSGDINPAGLDNLTKLAQDTDLLVFNCAVLDLGYPITI